MRPDQDSAHVRVPPPLLLLASILLGIGMQRLYPLEFIFGIARWALGLALIGIGLGLVLYCASKFRRAQTALPPWKTTSSIVTSGPYQYSRNPIYLSFVIFGLGMAALLNTFWVVLMQIPLIAIITIIVIQKEERYLEQKFGEDYQIYKTKVRRWI